MSWRMTIPLTDNKNRSELDVVIKEVQRSELEDVCICSCHDNKVLGGIRDPKNKRPQQDRSILQQVIGRCANDTEKILDRIIVSSGICKGCGSTHSSFDDVRASLNIIPLLLQKLLEDEEVIV